MFIDLVFSVLILRPFVCAFARVWGKRPQFILASIAGIVGTIVCETTTSYNQLLAGRIVQGMRLQHTNPSPSLQSAICIMSTNEVSAYPFSTSFSHP